MLQLPGTVARFLLEFAVGRREDVLARLDQALGQRQLVFVDPGAIFLHQHRVLGIEHGHHHHRTVALALADQTLVGALDAIAEAQLQLLDSEQSALRDDLAGEYGGFLTHVDNSLAKPAGYHTPAFPIIPVGD